jgi:hypothetical protein
MARVRTVDSHTHILTEEAMRLLGKEALSIEPSARDYILCGYARSLLGAKG